MKATVTLRALRAEDAEPIAAAFAAQGWHKPAAQYVAYLRQQEAGTRDVLVAEVNGDFAGYVTIVWESDYLPFRVAGIPEIVDLNVLIKYRRQGIATALLDKAERRIGKRAHIAGIGVGMTGDYGAAQILYVRRGYRPDGRGLAVRGISSQYGDQVTVDDDLTLYLTKLVARPKRPRSTAIVETPQGILLAAMGERAVFAAGRWHRSQRKRRRRRHPRIARGDRPLRRKRALSLRPRKSQQPAQSFPRAGNRAAAALP
jgi:ribosomal protein S18 acetylase RimI-like enzyme